MSGSRYVGRPLHSSRHPDMRPRLSDVPGLTRSLMWTAATVEPIPGSEIEVALRVVHAVEDDVHTFPVLRAFGSKGLEADASLALRLQKFDLRVGGLHAFSLDPNGDMVLSIGLQLDRLHDTAVPILILVDGLHAQRHLTPMLHGSINKGRHTLVVLKPPATEMVTRERLDFLR